MKNKQTTFQFLMEGDHEIIVFGVLKRLGIRPFCDQYQDLVSEGRLSFVEAYDRYPGDCNDEESRLNFIYQGVYWHILDILRRERRQNSHLDVETSEDVDVIATNDEEIESRVVLEGILAQLDDRECQMVSGLYNGQSMTAIASELHVSRKTLYQWRKRIIKKIDWGNTFAS
ncbi:RNA polymerase sigma factor, sigma-70 family protein [Fructilactobacillus fructivorans]|uniref:sigma-70 family RNA polymerase sigma factor n=1 Tax=Fructilactobacillus fructivorans TaxID=1614 RepID=UPI000704FF11|nr:sigma-70 family RNA polymerase sigma factor [Fructilactobacillus fructivorans]KRN13052.1 RNA polymerase sigma factor, sigma-70 family protein [Fructilactobacillus fructivorans]